ncbi:DUF3857 domain-containing protein [Pedobacter sp. GR22-6]|uniref:DUF3857 domain-containing protein n=1 Tax=Pedobacter sp. GR22-6 TaxID=3127957 RepID=UPI00307DAAD0
MKLKQTLLLFFFLVGLKGYSQSFFQYDTDKIPTALKSRATAVIRDMETVLDMRSPENVIMNVRKAVTILNKNADQRAALAIYYNKSTVIKSIKGTVLNAAGSVIGKFTQANFTDESASSDYSLFEDARIKSYAPTALSYPYTIIYEYEIRYKQNLIIPDWYANPYPDLAVEKNSYTFICKPDDQFRVKSVNFNGKPEELKTEKSKSLTWKVEQLNAFKKEPYAPDPDSYLTYIKIAPEHFSYYGYKGRYQNWNDLGKWVYDDLIKSRQVLAPEVITEVKQLVQGLEEKDKVKKIYEYVQKKTRYISIQVGIGGFQPFPAMEVQRLSYGDCKALVNYTQSLLKAVDINSLYCVVNAGSLKKDMSADFASMDQGNHIILCVPLKSDTTWLECTSQDTPFGYLGTFTDDRTVFACTAEGGKLLKTPALTAAANLLKRNAKLDISADGDINGVLQTELSGSQFDNYQHIINEPYSEQLKLLKGEYDIDNINFSDFKLSQRKDEHPLTTEKMKLTVDKYVPKTQGRLYLIPNIFSQSQTIPEVKNRTLPVYINRGYTDEDEINYELPAGYTLEYKPENRFIKTPFGTYRISIEASGNKLLYKRSLMINNGNFSADQYAAMVDFYSTITSLDREKVVFKMN